MSDSNEASARLAALRAGYVAQLPARLAELQAGLDALLHTGWNPELARTVHRLVHGLTGSGATFGFDHVSQSSRILERLLRTAVEANAIPDDAWPDTATRALENLTRAMQAAIAAPVASFRHDLG
jgi:HPt (histidine-containing phosphotransfer) domain-containing protein